MLSLVLVYRDFSSHNITRVCCFTIWSLARFLKGLCLLAGRETRQISRNRAEGGVGRKDRESQLRLQHPTNPITLISCRWQVGVQVLFHIFFLIVLWENVQFKKLSSASFSLRPPWLIVTFNVSNDIITIFSLDTLYIIYRLNSLKKFNKNIK